MNASFLPSVHARQTIAQFVFFAACALGVAAGALNERMAGYVLAGIGFCAGLFIFTNACPRCGFKVWKKGSELPREASRELNSKYCGKCHLDQSVPYLSEDQPS